MKYQTLKAGDIRDEADEQREIKINEARLGRVNGSHTKAFTEWESVSLTGHPILASDLMHLEFRRPTK